MTIPDAQAGHVVTCPFCLKAVSVPPAIVAPPANPFELPEPKPKRTIEPVKAAGKWPTLVSIAAALFIGLIILEVVDGNRAKRIEDRCEEIRLPARLGATWAISEGEELDAEYRSIQSRHPHWSRKALRW
jgi:hypothetical protein